MAGAASVFAASPNTPEAPSKSCVRHCAIWFGCTSNCWASSASVFSPLTAASATFALKAGVWFRRGRLVIVSPAREPSWPLSGRNATYRPVRIRRASSLGLVASALSDAILLREAEAQRRSKLGEHGA